MLLRMTNGFDLKKDPLSKLGSIKQTAVFFNVIMVLFGLGQLIFVLQLMWTLNILSNIFFLFLIAVAAMSTSLLGLFPLNERNKLHKLFAILAFGFSCLVSLILDVYLAPSSLMLGVLSLAFSATAITALVSYFRSHSLGAYQEFIFLLGVLGWNLVMSCFLLLK